MVIYGHPWPVVRATATCHWHVGSRSPSELSGGMKCMPSIACSYNDGGKAPIIIRTWRKGRDSNPRYAVKRIHEFQSCSLNHSDISPQLLCCTYLVAVPGWDPARTRNAPKSRAEINLYLLICHLRNWCHPLRANARQGIHGQINRNLAKFFNI